LEQFYKKELPAIFPEIPLIINNNNIAETINLVQYSREIRLTDLDINNKVN